VLLCNARRTKRSGTLVLVLTSQPGFIVVVCALQFERDRLAPAELGAAFELDCCGPGAKGMARWAEKHVGDVRPVVLAGLAGGLVEHAQVGSAFVVREVRAAGGDVLRPTWDLGDSGAPQASTSCPPRTLTSMDAKRAWHRAHRTELADLESEAFARAMQQAGRPWAIVRGVSDAVGDALPDSIDTWVDEQGRTRRGFVALALLKNPALVATAQRLGRQARQAMDAVAEVLRRSANPR
jgi:hypothetical protein